MRYQMKLRSQPFEKIRSGRKTFELRLYDEKRQRIKVGDEIEFSCTDAEREPFVVADDMNRYYSVEEQAKFGVVGIEIKLI